jgi:hypothetical protein
MSLINSISKNTIHKNQFKAQENNWQDSRHFFAFKSNPLTRRGSKKYWCSVSAGLDFGSMMTSANGDWSMPEGESSFLPSSSDAMEL